MNAFCAHTIAGRFWRLLLLFVLLVPLFPRPTDAALAPHVVINWTSPGFGFSIDYRREYFVYDTETLTETREKLSLKSDAGVFWLEAMPFDRSIDTCAIDQLTAEAESGSSFDVIQPVSTGSGSGTVRVVTTGSLGQPVFTTVRVDCIASPDSAYLIRFTHAAATEQFGLYETAAQAIRASYLPGYPADNPLPPNVTHPDGLLEASFSQMFETIEPPADSNLVNHPTRFFAVDILFDSLYPVDATIEGGRVIIPGIGAALSWTWFYEGDEFEADSVVIQNGVSVVGRFIFAVPESRPDVTFCYQHVTNSDCSLIFDYEFSGVRQSPDDGTVTGGGPNSRPRINPGR